MPSISVWLIRISLINLVLVVLSGSVLLVHKGLEIHPGIWAILPFHYELAIWGWLVPFIMGTAYWIFPRHLTGRPRGEKWKGVLVVSLFTGGLLLLILSNTGFKQGIIEPAGRAMLLLSLIIYAFIMWRRIVSYRNRQEL